MILKPRYLARFRHVGAVLISHGFADVLAALDLARFLPGRERERRSDEEREQQRARSLRLALEELGATYIKLGQILSTRPDLLPPAYIAELERLQSRVEPFPYVDARAAIEAELKAPLEQFFEGLKPEPVASASLSQVHRARLKFPQGPHFAGLLVAVKVLRPGVEREVETDLAILGEVARFLARSALGRRADFVGIVEQLARTLGEELDLTREAANAHHFAATFAAFPRLRVPAVIDELTTPRMLVSEFVAGRELLEVGPGSVQPGLAEELWRGYLHQILVEGMFQCDPHPGNFLIDGEGRVVLLDHGMVAAFGREAQLHLLGLLLALVDHDGERVAEACLEIGLLGDDLDERRFRAEIGQMTARLAGLPLERLDLGLVFVDIARTAYRCDVRIPPEMMLLGKTLLNLEGVCRRLDPGLKPVETMREMASQLLGQQLGREVTRQRALASALEARSLLSEVPGSIRRILRRAASGDFRVGLRVEGEAEIHSAMQQIANRITLGLITAALIVGSALLLNVKSGWTLGGYPVFALFGFLLAAGLGLYLVAKIILGDRY